MSLVGKVATGVAAFAAVSVVAFGGNPPIDDAAAASTQKKPNVVVLMSDDQTQEEMRLMPQLRRLIGNAGATFPTSVTNWPLCCPSRATYQTGQYAHNHGVLGNSPPIGGFGQFDMTRTLPVWLQRAGYYTAHIGKFLNGYETSPVGVPPGWSEWHGSKNTYTFYGYKLLEEGQINTYGSPQEDPDNPARPETYSTDVYTDKAVQVINERAPGDQPFFLSVAYLAPHSGKPNSSAGEPEGRCEDTAKPPVRYNGALETTPLPQPPSFNEADIADKPAAIANQDLLNDAQIARTTKNYRCRGESVMGVDDGAGRVIEALRASGELDNTLVIYTSDNGFFHGEHRIGSGKNQVYEEAIRVPLLMRGPGIPRGVTVNDLAINADVTATIVDATGAKPDLLLDGLSLLPFTEHPSRKHGRELLIEQDSPEGEDGEPLGTEYRAIRTTRYKYVRNATGELELYDLQVDPYELQNLAGDPNVASIQAALAQRLAALETCAGANCHIKPALQLELPKPGREGGKRCTPEDDFVLAVRNKAQSALVKASFRVAGNDGGVVSKEPFERTIPKRLLPNGHRARIEVDATLIDGRVLTLHKRVRICR